MRSYKKKFGGKRPNNTLINDFQPTSAGREINFWLSW